MEENGYKIATAARFRRCAERNRLAAQQTPLPMVRRKHLEAAEKFDILADEIFSSTLVSHPDCPRG